MQCVDCLNRPATTPDGRCRVCSVAEAQTALEDSTRARAMPPAAGGYPVAPRWMFRPVGGLATAVMVLLGVCIATDLLSVFAGFRIRSLMDDLLTASDSEIDAADALYAATGVLQLLAMLATAVVFLIWFHRTRENAELFDAGQLRHSAGWSIGAWFIPIANLWIPKKIANDIWRASKPPATHGMREPGGVGLVTGWWAVWVTSLVFDRGASASYRTADTPEALKSAVAGLVLSDVVSITAAVLAILYVRKLSKMQELKHAFTAPPAPPAYQPPYGAG
ncbi:DUF4328 domain-containing protein [Streptomyces boninensis]|uniref:DUF4328 domain-containing protein n=1 Tax=Streptomyces boninensis TaxID=2039455 RepID=UPI003B20C3D3